jgi:tetratricopeptide (TPR) repeat protein
VTPSEVRQIETAIDEALAAWELDRAEQLAEQYRRSASRLTDDADPARAPWFRAGYLAGQVALAAGRLTQALERLSPLLDVADRLPAELAGRVHLYTAEALARLHRGPEARQLLDVVPGALLDRQPLLHLRALRIRLWLGEIGCLDAELRACSQALAGRDDTANRALLACEEGRAWDAAGDLARAGSCWEQAERLSRALGNAPIRADVLIQLARLDHLRGHLASALDRYDFALTCAAAGAQALEIQWRRLLVRLDLGQWDQVRSAADRLLHAVPLDQMPEEVGPLAGMVHALLYDAAPAGSSTEHQAYLAAARGEAEAACALYRQALAATPSPERHARLALALGLLALTQGHRAEALSWLHQAEEAARSLNLPEVLGRALQARGQAAAEWDADEARARRLFEEAVLIAEAQARQFSHRSDAASYRQQRGSVLRQLLRAACRRGDPVHVFHYQELERGRLLLELWHAEAPRSASGVFVVSRDLADLESRLAALEEELCQTPATADKGEQRQATLRQCDALLLQRDRLLEDLLRDRSRRDNSALPALPELADLERALPAGTLYLAPAVLDDELYLLAVSHDKPAQVVRGARLGARWLEAVERLRGCLTSQLARYRSSLPLGQPERATLDALLEDVSRGPLGEALFDLLATHPCRPQRLVWVPDGPLHGLPIHALRRHGRYLIEDVDVVWSFSGALYVHQCMTRRRRRGWLRPAVVVTETPAVLPEVAREGQGVAASFLRSRTLHGAAATRAALHPYLARARVVHLACHADFDAEHPLAASIGLPSGETLRALDWLDEPVAGLPLVTLSACRSAEVAPLLGREVFGLVTGLLGGGVRAVLAGLWPVADREALPLMWRFYRSRLTRDLAGALAHAQRDALAAPDSSPLFWGAFALFGDAAALPAPGRCWRWLARWRQRWHARRFPVRVDESRG